MKTVAYLAFALCALVATSAQAQTPIGDFQYGGVVLKADDDAASPDTKCRFGANGDDEIVGASSYTGQTSSSALISLDKVSVVLGDQNAQSISAGGALLSLISADAGELKFVLPISGYGRNGRKVSAVRFDVTEFQSTVRSANVDVSFKVQATANFGNCSFTVRGRYAKP